MNGLTPFMIVNAESPLALRQKKDIIVIIKSGGKSGPNTNVG
jgi:hypothetical protein